MTEDTDFAALYRELGIDAACSLAQLRSAWRRRVATLHPDLGGSAEDTGRLQRLNRLYDAALDFHARYGRMPGAAVAGSLSPEGVDTPLSAPRPAGAPVDASLEIKAASGFARLSRCFVAVSLIAIAILGWRLAGNGQRDGHRDDRGNDLANVQEADAVAAQSAAAASEVRKHPARNAAPAMAAAQVIAPGMGKDTVRDILGEPLDMHALRWTYGPSWVEFHCGKVVDWYSSPLRPLRVSATRADTAAPADRDCD